MGQAATQTTFDAQVVSAPVVLVDFTATWCGPCQQLGRLLVDFQRRHPEVLVVKVDADRETALMRRYSITSLPTMLVFHRGRLVNRHVGNPGSVAALERLVLP